MLTGNNKKNSFPNDFSQKIDAILSKKFGEKNAIDTSLYAKMAAAIMANPQSASTQQNMLTLLRDLGKDFYTLIPQDIKKTQDIQLEALRQGIIDFSEIDESLEKDIHFMSECISLSIQKRGIVFFIEQIYEKLPKKTKKTTKSILESIDFVTNISSSEHLYIDLYLNQKSFLETLKKVGFFSEHINISVSQKILEYIGKHIFREDILQLEIYQQVCILLGEILSVDIKNIPEKLSILVYNQVTGLIAQKLKKQQKKSDADTQISENKKEEEAQKDNSEHIQNPIYISGSYYYTPEKSQESVLLSSEEYKKSTEISRENFAYFSQLLTKIDLGFLLDSKHRAKIQIATGIDFFAGDGMTQYKVFSFLNNIGKALGIPEYGTPDEDGNKKTGSFRTLGDALYAFGVIRSTGYVNSQHICDISKKGDYSIVELALKMKGKIGGSYNEILIANWN